MPVNDTVQRRTEAAIAAMQDSLSGAALQSLNTTLQRLQLADRVTSRLQQRASALNVSAAPLWCGGGQGMRLL